MKNTKQSITFKVMLGYMLIATLAALAVWFIYSQVLSYTSMAESNVASNKKLYLVGEAATNLYEAESLSRRFIQTKDSSVFKAYKAEIDSIRFTLNTLRQTYTDTILKKEVDSINFLLTQKTANLEELLILQAQKGNQSYYTKVISELQKVDENFEDPDYEERFKALKPYQRDILIKLLEYSKNENQEITEETIDSLVSSVKNVLTELEIADRRYRATLRSKENELLANEIRLNGQLQNLLSTIEEEERRASLSQVTAAQDMVKKTSQIIAVLAAISLVVIFLFLFLVIRDVTQSQRYRNELEHAKQYAERILKSKEQFMATVTHDLRSPLNTVVGYTNLLEKSELSRSQSHYLDHLKKSSDFILRLVNDLLDLSKLEAGRMLVEKLPFNPKHLIEDTVENTIAVNKPEQVAVEVVVPEALDRHVISDPFRIKQILINLVANAGKFTEEGTISITSFFENKGRHTFLVVEVKDTGIGISEDKKETVFEEFSQENSSIEKRFGGSGLGLAITKKLAELLHGDITLESALGKGSKFTLKVPITFAPDDKKEPVKEEFVSKNVLPGTKALIVDDELAQITLLSELIKTTGIQIETANNGEEAIVKLKNDTFDLILTDIQMPKMNGFQLFSFIKSNPACKDIPVIALSGKPDTSPSDYQKMGFHASLLKPYQPVELLETIEKVLQVDFKKTTRLNGNKPPSEENYTLTDIKLFSGDDPAALGTILTAFIQSTKTNLELLKAAHNKGDMAAISAVAHKMLPMFRQIKAQHIVGQLTTLETGTKAQIQKMDMESLALEINQLLKTLNQEIKV